jgi:maleate cis-trans isomerase
MYGWRARIGLLLPVDNAVMEPELYSLRLPGISFHSVRLTTSERSQMPDDGIRLAPIFRNLGIDMVIYACAATSFLQGVDANETLTRRLEEVCKVPVVTATGAMMEALEAMKIKFISVVTPYAPMRGDALVDFLTRKEYQVVNVVHHEMNLFETNLKPPHFIYQLARQTAHSDAEATLISGTNLRTMEIIEMLESDTNKPVITSNQAALWSVGKKLAISINWNGCGQLFFKCT